MVPPTLSSESGNIYTNDWNFGVASLYGSTEIHGGMEFGVIHGRMG